MRVGIDLVSIRRVERLLSSTEECERLFTDAEMRSLHNDTKRAGGYLAVKEAYCKAIGKKIDWLLLEVCHEESGAPFLRVGDDTITSVSISHDGEYATAVVLLT